MNARRTQSITNSDQMVRVFRMDDIVALEFAPVILSYVQFNF